MTYSYSHNSASVNPLISCDFSPLLDKAYPSYHTMDLPSSTPWIQGISEDDSVDERTPSNTPSLLDVVIMSRQAVKSVASAFDLCLKTFEETLKILRSNGESSSVSNEINKSSERIQKWSINNGANISGMSSLDENLRDSTQLRDVVIESLDRIAISLARISQLVSIASKSFL